MLTKSLVRYRLRKGKIQPSFIDPEDTALLGSAADLIEIFEQGVGLGREALSEAASEIVEVSPFEAVIARGFEKLLLDRCDFETPEDEALPNLRAEVFSHTSKLLSENEFDDLDAYHAHIEQHFKRSAADLADHVYSDLPGQHPLIAFKSLTPVQLLHRYNCSTIQWLLLHCSTLEVTIHGTRTGALRQIFKYLRFHQLLARVTQESGKVFRLDIEGPLSMFFQTKKYGLRLAMFFPALLHQEQWQLRADIAISNTRKGLLELDSACGIKPERERFHAYIPKEIRDFGNSLESRLEGWKVKPFPGFMLIDGEHIFPDFTLTHASGHVVSMELFHQWHKSHCVSRLQKLEEMTPGLLIVGLDQKLKRDAMISELISGSQAFVACGFGFREMPTVNVVQPILNRIVESLDKP